MFQTRKRLKERIDELQRENQSLIESLGEERQINGKRICGYHCQICQSGIKITPLGCSSHYECKLNIKCKDFKEVEHE